jgi:hypothetical protein
MRHQPFLLGSFVPRAKKGQRFLISIFRLGSLGLGEVSPQGVLRSVWGTALRRGDVSRNYAPVREGVKGKIQQLLLNSSKQTGFLTGFLTIIFK